MIRGLQGVRMTQRVPGESFQAFIPNPLPPDPPIVIDIHLADLIEKANRALGRLDGLGRQLPDLSLFLYYYVRKEAVLSSQIEGTQSSLSDLLLYESKKIPAVPLDDVREVSNYVAAVNYGIEYFLADKPFTLKMIREIHGVLLSKGRGEDKRPGEFRHSQNWIGGSPPGNAMFVPPPPGEVTKCMSDLEKFLHDMPNRTPTLIKAALMHAQFETVHPFLDGNGRLGRLLIPLLLCYENALNRPLLYLSLYFKMHREKYYNLLQEVRITGNWESWLEFFLEGVAVTADQAFNTGSAILTMSVNNKLNVEELGKNSMPASRIHEWMLRHPIFTLTDASADLGISFPTVSRWVQKMRDIDLIKEISGRSRGQIYAYQELLNILNEGTEIE